MSLRFPALIAVLACVALLALAGGAWAQPSAGDKAAAEALFQEAKQLFEQERFDEACSKFLASQELDSGIGTLLYLGECYERTGKTASSWATFKEAASMARARSETEREEVARSRAAALEARLSRLTIRGPAEVMNLDGLQVLLNGTSVPRATWGTPVPVDPGVQRVEVSAPGYDAWSTELELAPGPAEASVDIPALSPLTAAPVEPAPEPNRPPVDAPLDPGPEADAGADGGQRLVGFVIGGIGVAGLVVGSVFGLQAISKNDESMQQCRTEQFCSDEGLALRESAKDAAAISTIAFTSGAVLAATGAVLVLAAPSGSSPTQGEGFALRAFPLLAPGQAGALLEGSF